MKITECHRVLAANLISDARAFIGTPWSIGKKVFLAAVLGGQVKGQDMSMIKELHAAGLINLARADFVQAMDYAKVAASEWAQGVGTFHFIVVEPLDSANADN